MKYVLQDASTMFLCLHLPTFCLAIPFFPLLPETYQQILQRKFRVALRLVHRCPFLSARNLFTITAEQPLEFYVKKYIRKRLRSMHTTDLGSSLFFNDIFVWDGFYKRKGDNLGHFSVDVVCDC